MIYWRKQLKEIMGIEDHLVNDVCVTCFCPMLSICQQGTAVDKAMGYEVTGCCTVENTDYY
jgi:Zn-finger protein